MLIGRARGFTLVEMIVVIVITASLGLAVYTTFAQGVRLWARASKDRGEWRVDLFGEQITENLRNAFRDSRWPLKGARTELIFAALALQGSGTLSTKEAPTYFRYVYDPRAKAVVSQKYDFEDVLASRSASKVSTSALQGVLAFELEYYSYDPKAKAYRWGSQWNKDCFPETVKITIELEKMSHRKWIRSIRMPTGGACTE